MSDHALRAAERDLLALPTYDSWATYVLAWRRAGEAGREPMVVLIDGLELAGWPCRDPRLAPVRGDVVVRTPIHSRKLIGPGNVVDRWEGEPEAWRCEAAYYGDDPRGGGGDYVHRLQVRLREDGTPGRANAKRSTRRVTLDAWRDFVRGGRVIWIVDPFGPGRRMSVYDGQRLRVREVSRGR